MRSEAVIERCLRSAIPHIDHWTIADTGSTDQTMQIIRDTLDGIPGKRTLAATVAFQSDRGLKPDGIVGPKTREALRIALLTSA